MAADTKFSASTNISSEEVYDFTCTICANKKKNIEAVKFCLECRQYLCSQCTESHNSFPLMAGHVLEKAKLTSRDRTFSLPSIPTELCPKHHAEIIKMYCAFHDQVACTVCTTIYHKACNEIHYIPDVAGTLDTKQMNTDTITALLKASEKMRTLIEMCSKAVKDLNAAKQTTLKAIEKFRKELNQMLDELETKTKQQLDHQYQTLQSNWQGIIDNGIEVIHNLQKQLDQLQNTESNTSQQFVLAKMSKANISLVDTMSRQFQPSSIQITFSQNQAIKSCFEQLSSLGDISESINKGKLGLYKVKESHKHNVRIKSDTRTCNICGSCVLNSGHLLLADYCNKTLKLFDTNKNAVTSDCTMSDSPNAVCTVSDVEAAASLCNKTIQFVSISNGLLPTRVLQIGHNCRGLAVVDDNMYITDNCSLYVHALNGKLLRTINKDHSGQEIFLTAYDITVSNDGNIYVADLSNGLITLDTQGQVLWKYSGSDRKGVCGVCTDGSGNVFICGYRSRAVLQLGHDGHRLGELITTQVDITSLLFNKKNCTLVIIDALNYYIHIFCLE